MTHPSSFDVEGTFQRLFQNIFDPIMDRFGYPAHERSYVIRFYLNGINAVVVEWLKNGCLEPAEDIAGLLRVCILGRTDRDSVEIRDKILKNS